MGDSLTVMGWGTTIQGTNAPPPVLQEVNVNYISNSECIPRYGPGDVTNDMMCCVEAGQGSCQGDSGGPLVIQGSSGDIQVGIVSWGIDCALREYPGKFPIFSFAISAMYQMAASDVLLA